MFSSSVSILCNFTKPVTIHIKTTKYFILVTAIYTLCVSLICRNVNYYSQGLFFFFFLNKVHYITFSCCCSSLFNLAKTVLVSLLRLIDAWIAFLSFPIDLRIYYKYFNVISLLKWTSHLQSLLFKWTETSFQNF